jgi:hypothetical protein
MKPRATGYAKPMACLDKKCLGTVTSRSLVIAATVLVVTVISPGTLSSVLRGIERVIICDVSEFATERLGEFLRFMFFNLELTNDLNAVT